MQKYNAAAADIVPIPLNKFDVLGIHALRPVCKTIEQVEVEEKVKKRELFNAYILKPYFESTVRNFEKRLGKKYSKFTEKEALRVEEEFIKKYMEVI